MIVLKLLTFLCSTRLRPGSEAFVSSRQQVQIMSRWSSLIQYRTFLPHNQHLFSCIVGMLLVSSCVLYLVQDSHYKSTCI